MSLYAVFAAVAFLFHVATIVIIVKTKAFKLFLHRLTLYLTIGGMLRTVAYVLQVLAVNIDLPGTHPVVLRKGWEPVCVSGAVMIHYSPFFQTFTVLWTCYIIFRQMKSPNRSQSDQFAIGFKKEILAITFVILAPLLFCWEPFITNSYGLSGTRCWIVSTDCLDGYGYSFIYEMTINVVPNLLLTLVGLALLLLATILFVKSVISTDTIIFRKGLKEMLPVAIYPTLYMLILLSRMIGLMTGKYKDAVGLSFMALMQLCSITLPLSLLVRPSVRQALCSQMRTEEDYDYQPISAGEKCI